jgi:contact-dependent growth inhibition (CDI) system CdiI-like immunity protein
MTAPGPQEDLSLEAIENDRWGDAPDDATRLISTVHELRRKPIGELTPEDLRVLIGQGEGLEVLVPRALSQLADDPLVEGDLYPGDLLAAVLRVPRGYWSTHQDLLAKINEIVAAVDKSYPDLSVGSDLSCEINSFRETIRS